MRKQGTKSEKGSSREGRRTKKKRTCEILLDMFYFVQARICVDPRKADVCDSVIM